MPAVDLLKRAVPSWAKRRHERIVTGRYLRTANELTTRYADANGLEVRRGPLAGLAYPPEFLVDHGDAVAKLVGTYEQELHPVFAAWIAAGYERIVDIGSAEGYYAVGLAKASPGTTVVAYDIDPDARRGCATLAAHNDVADRVRIEGLCTTADLAGLPPEGTAVLSDCEGGELELLDPEAAPALRGIEILVELHDFIDPSISATITERFAATHDVEFIEGTGRDGAHLPELASFTASERALALSERRPGPMRWAWLRPRA